MGVCFQNKCILSARSFTNLTYFLFHIINYKLIKSRTSIRSPVFDTSRGTKLDWIN